MNQRIEKLNKAVDDMRGTKKHRSVKPEAKPEIQEKPIEPGAEQ